MYVLQKLAIKMAPRVIVNPALLVPTLIIGGIALACEALDWAGNGMQPYVMVSVKKWLFPMKEEKKMFAFIAAAAMTFALLQTIDEWTNRSETSGKNRNPNGL